MNDKQTKAIEELYISYSVVLNPLIQNYEAITENFPIEILNEIRSIFSHIAKCYKPKVKASFVDTHIAKAHNHLKRAILDGFKYNILAYQKNLKAFEDKFDRILDLADNGQFIEKFWNARQACLDSFVAAKSAESANDETIEQVYAMYEKTFNEYKALNDLISSKEKDLSVVQSKIENQYIKKDEEYARREEELRIREKRAHKYNVIMFWIAVGSLLIGIVGIAVGLCGWLLPH